MLVYSVCSRQTNIVSGRLKASGMPLLIDRSDAVIHTAEHREPNGLNGKPEFSLYISLVPGFKGGFFFFSRYLSSKPGN